jgi:hypothetical protein
VEKNSALFSTPFAGVLNSNAHRRPGLVPDKPFGALPDRISLPDFNIPTQISKNAKKIATDFWLEEVRKAWKQKFPNLRIISYGGVNKLLRAGFKSHDVLRLAIMELKTDLEKPFPYLMAMAKNEKTVDKLVKEITHNG